MMERAVDALVDVMRVPAIGDPSAAVIALPRQSGAIDIECDLLVVGGGTGGVAAALAAARRGRVVHLIEETDWLGGQLTAQGVSALDEHEHIERFGGTASYYALRNALRDRYRSRAGDAGRRPDFNPGNCWVTRLAFEPAVAADVITQMLRPQVEAKRLHAHLRTKLAAVTVEGDRITSLRALDLDSGKMLRFHPTVVVDASELGDVLPLAGAEYRVGAETIADTGEPHAQPVERKPQCVQSFTYTFGLERRSEGARHTIAAPVDYAHFRASQPYSLTIQVHGGEIYGEQSGWLAYKLFDTMPETKGSLWTYRRLIDRSQFGSAFAHDLSMINWPGNDYRDAGLLDRPATDVAAALSAGKRVSLGFLHWLQTEAPATGERNGAPEIALQPTIMGTADGLSKHPYIREARRIVAMRTIVEQDVAVHAQPGPRARHCDDSVGVGWYPIDIHRAGPEDVGVSCRTRPFQIPLAALVPIRIENLIAAAKNIGTTHITNGCYRLHPVEWNLGEAAGALAAFALDRSAPPRGVCGRAELRGAFQRTLADEGVPLVWLVDVGVEHPAFAAVQRLAIGGRLPLPDDLMFRPQDPISDADWKTWGGRGTPPRDRASAATAIAAHESGPRHGFLTRIKTGADSR
jgi:hypothetical protein